MNQAYSEFCAAMKIWSTPDRVSRKNVVWFVVINTGLVCLASLGLAIIEAVGTGASLLHIYSLHVALTLPMTAALLYRGAIGLQEIVILKDELQSITTALAARNAELEQAHVSLEQQANGDFLTGLGNRRSFQISLYNRHNAARIDRAPFWLSIIDLDNFKPVNDLHGHDAGDIVLKTVARRLRHQFVNARTATISRLGGDEFAVIFDQTSAPDIFAAEALINTLTAALARPIDYKGHSLCVEASAGLIEWQSDISVTHMLQAADTALMNAKRGGKANVRVVRKLADSRAI